MKGAALIVLGGLTIWIFSTGWLFVAILPALGMWKVIEADRGGDAVDQVLLVPVYLTVLVCIYLALKSLFSAF